MTQNNPALRVNFLVVGAQKSGTTTLHGYLQDHPDIEMANKKEVHFFNNQRYFDNTADIDYSIYHSFFQMSEHKTIRGEATPAYMYCRDAPRRIWQYNPDIKIIIILRNPIERAFSHWNMEVLRGAENLSFFEAITNETDRCRAALPHQHYVYSYLDRGLYSSQLRELWRFFKLEQVLVLKYDELKKNPQRIVTDMYDFLKISSLDITSSGLFEKKVLHKAKYNNKLSKKLKASLLDFYKFEILQLESLLTWDCHEWLE